MKTAETEGDPMREKKMDRALRESYLFDLYGSLLTEHKQKLLYLHHEEDLSLSEIAESLGISRAAVSDALRSGAAQLESFEEKLGLLRELLERRKLVRSLKELLEAGDTNILKNDRIANILDRLGE